MFEKPDAKPHAPRTMKTTTHAARTLLAVASLATATHCQAQIAFGLDIKSSNNASGSPLADKLYNVSSLGTDAANRLPGGTSFWIVIDGGNNGVNFLTALPGTTFNIDSLLQSDDVLFQTTLVSPGRISRAITGIPYDLRLSSDPAESGYAWSKPVYGLLFNESNVDSDRPGSPGFDPAFDGATFGVISFGSKQIPEFGNALAVVQEPLYADSYSFQPIPEPATTAWVAGSLLGLGVALRRLRQNRR